METRLLFQDASAFETPMLAVFAVDLAAGKSDTAQPKLLSQSQPLAAAAQKLLDSGEFKAGLGETAMLHGPAGLKAARLLLVGLGKASDLSLDSIRKAAGTAVRSAKPRAIRSLAVALPTDTGSAQLSPALVARALVEGVELGAPDYDTYRSDRKDV